MPKEKITLIKDILYIETVKYKTEKQLILSKEEVEAFLCVLNDQMNSSPPPPDQKVSGKSKIFDKIYYHRIMWILF